jgi:hypothetical protein
VRGSQSSEVLRGRRVPRAAGAVEDAGMRIRPRQYFGSTGLAMALLGPALLASCTTADDPRAPAARVATTAAPGFTRVDRLVLADDGLPSSCAATSAAINPASARRDRRARRRHPQRSPRRSGCAPRICSPTRQPRRAGHDPRPLPAGQAGPARGRRRSGRARRPRRPACRSITSTARDGIDRSIRPRPSSSIARSPPPARPPPTARSRSAAATWCTCSRRAISACTWRGSSSWSAPARWSTTGSTSTRTAARWSIATPT